MNNSLSAILLLAAEGQSASGWDIALQYIIYGVVIVLSILILIFISRRSRLPGHEKVKERLDGLGKELEELKTSSKTRIEFVKSVAHVLYVTDDLAYITALLSSKERYSDFGTISTLLGGAHSELAPYKYGKKSHEEAEGLQNASEKIAAAIAIMNGIIERDADIKGRRR